MTSAGTGEIQIAKLIADRGHVQLEAVASIDWVAEHLEGFLVRIAESNGDSLAYASGHIPGALEIDGLGPERSGAPRRHGARGGGGPGGRRHRVVE